MSAFFSPENLLAPLPRGVSDLWAIFLRFKKLSQERVGVSQNNDKTFEKRVGIFLLFKEIFQNVKAPCRL